LEIKEIKTTYQIILVKEEYLDQISLISYQPKGCITDSTNNMLKEIIINKRIKDYRKYLNKHILIP